MMDLHHLQPSFSSSLKPFSHFFLSSSPITDHRSPPSLYIYIYIYIHIDSGMFRSMKIIEREREREIDDHLLGVQISEIREIDDHLCLSPAHFLILTTAIAWVNAASALTVDDLHFPLDLGSIQDRDDEALLDRLEAILKPMPATDTAISKAFKAALFLLRRSSFC
ncbi:unnamed protein product [Camellia sinensis]